MNGKSINDGCGCQIRCSELVFRGSVHENANKLRIGLHYTPIDLLLINNTRRYKATTAANGYFEKSWLLMNM